MNFTRQEFFDSTFKEIVDLIEELNSYQNAESTSNEYVKKVVPIEQVPFL
ncbi:MAG: hypothetical protein ACRDBY_05310 [Cetobacterium sp.]